MSQELDYSEFRKVFEQIEGVKDKLPTIKAEFTERLGKQMLDTVRGNIKGSGKVQGWQEAYQGSRHGYAAVRAQAKQYETTKAGKQYAWGHITNAIENGHVIRYPAGYPGAVSKRYRSRVDPPSRLKVAGKHFYKSSQAVVDGMAKSAAKEIAEKIAKEIEGK